MLTLVTAGKMSPRTSAALLQGPPERSAAVRSKAAHAPAPVTFALVDGENFYCACERLFRPDLSAKPVAVLSNNDGCVVARSEEVRRLGVRMGAPYFDVRAVLEEAGTSVHSSNYALYGSLSARVTSVLEEVARRVEVYSIDEAFCELPRFERARQLDLSLQIVRRVRRHVGLPVRVSTGPTKVLSKIAQQLAKEQRKAGGLPVAHAEPADDALLARVAVEDVWGIGPAYAKKLRSRGIGTALQLRDVDDRWVRQELTVVGLRLVYELRGISCLALEDVAAPRKSLIRSGSFGERVEDLESLREAVSTHTSRAAARLRQEKLVARAVQVFLTTGPYTDPHARRRYTNRAAMQLMQPTAYTPALVSACRRLLERIYRPGYAYKKVGVVCLEIGPEEPVQANLFVNQQGDPPGAEDPKKKTLMAAVDALNARYGRGTVQVAACGLRTKPDEPRAWERKAGQVSPRYLTQVEDMPRVRT